MSYDLYFYKKKASTISEEDIKVYLNKYLQSTNENTNQWFIEDENTEVYFSFDLNDPNDDDEVFEDYIYTHLTFNLNFLRPDFFGVHAFKYVDQLINDLDFCVINPQSNIQIDLPEQPLPGGLHQNWSTINATHSARYAKEYELEYLPLEKSNDIYFFNLNRSKIQESLGEGYFVPRLIFLLTKVDKRIVTLCIWAEHMPYVLPPADYYMIVKKYRKFFRMVEESGLISAASLHERFRLLLNDYDFKDCKIIHPENAAKAEKLFNSTPIEYELKDFAERISVDKIINVKF